jgi:integrase
MGRPPKIPEGLWARNGTYYARFRTNGREVRKRLSSDLKAAKEMLNELKSRADKADFGLLDNDYSYADLKKEFLAWVKQTRRKPDEYGRHLKQIEAFCSITRVKQVDHRFVVDYRNWRIKDVSPRTVNIEVGTLRNMLNMGVAWNHIGSNPIAGIGGLAVDNPTKNRRSLAVEEVLKLFEVSPEYLKPVWRFFMSTGVRREELATLLWSDIDFRRHSFLIRAEVAKSHQAREIPLDDGMMAVLSDLRASSKSPFVFVNKRGNPHRNNLLTRFYTVCKKAGIEDGKRGGSVDLHSLRVTFTTLALENGANPKAVQKILGHSTLAMTMGVYARGTDKSKREAINALPFVSGPKRAQGAHKSSRGSKRAS